MRPFDMLGVLVLEDGRRWIDAAHAFQREDALAVLEGEQPYQFLTRARGASKTTDLAAVALALLLTASDAERLYWLAADADQGALAVDSIAGFAARTPELAMRVDVRARRVLATATGASLTVLAADAPGAWGLRPAAVFVDELAQWSDTPAPRRLWEAVATAAAKRSDARLVVLTTAGDPAHFAAKILDHARSSPLWRVHEVAGPAPWMSADRLEEQRARLPESAFARLFENEWTEGEDRLTGAEALEECVSHDGPLDYDAQHRYVVGLDIGLKRDRTVAAVCHREGARVVLDRMAVWQGSRLKPVRLDDVEDWVGQAARGYGAARIVVDPWQAVGLAQRLRGGGLAVHEFAFTAASVGRLASTLFNLLRDRALGLPDDRELLDELAHVRLRETSPGTWRIEHAPGRHDDRAIALALAAAHLLAEAQHAPPSTGPGVWSGGLPSWQPEHLDEFDARRADHLRTMRQLREVCPECVAEAEARRAAAAAPPPPERRGQFLIDGHNHNRR